MPKNLTRWWWPILLSAVLLAAWTMLFVWPVSPLRPVITWAFLLVCPGLAYVRLLGLREWLAQAVLSVALSLALLIVVGTLMLVQGAWHPERGFLAAALITAGGVALQSAQIWRAGRQPAAADRMPGWVRQAGQWLAGGLAHGPRYTRPAYAVRPAAGRGAFGAARDNNGPYGFLSDVGGTPGLGIRDTQPMVPVSRAVLEPVSSGQVWAPDEDWDLPSAEDLRGLTSTLPWMNGISRRQAPGVPAGAETRLRTAFSGRKLARLWRGYRVAGRSRLRANRS